MNLQTAHSREAGAVDRWIPSTLAVVDSHTEGEPTRVVVGDWPRLDGETMAERRRDLKRRFDVLRSAVTCEPRGHEAVVGAVLTPPAKPGSAAGVIFFNNVGYLGMCGHGLIGVVRTLEHLGRLGPGEIAIDTPAGTVGAVLDPGGSVTVRNVVSYCHAADVAVDVPGIGRVVGDVAYGGNWFFITDVSGPPVALANVVQLSSMAREILAGLRAGGITGADGADIDHVELCAPPDRGDADGKNFVLCPGGAYDRSPCGTGTSAKMACLHARGKLVPGAEWRQESVTGSLFTGWLTRNDEGLVPHIRGRAFITGEATLRFDPDDPFRLGLPAS